MDKFLTISNSELDFNGLYTRMLLFTWSHESTVVELSETNIILFTKSLEKYLKLNSDLEYLIINSNSIKSVHDHVVNKIVDFIFKNKIKAIIFSDGNEISLQESIDNYMKQQSRKDYNFIGGKIFTINIKETSNIDFFLELCEKKEQQHLKKIVKNSYASFPEKRIMSSTPLMSSGEFNATSFISDPNQFSWIVTCMAEEINKIIQKEAQAYSLISVSLRGSAIAGNVWEVLHYLCGINIHIIDHIGPKHDVIERPKCCFQDGKPINFIYIGDFILGGTEIKISSVYCNFLGGNLKHAFAVGKFTSLDIIDRKTSLHCLVDLKDCLKDEELNYILD